MSDAERVVIVGAGGQAKIYTEIADQIGLNLLGYVSSEPVGSIINGYKVLCDIDTFVSTKNEINVDSIIVSIGDNLIRNKIYERLSLLNLKNINLIHPTAFISSDVVIGEGVYIGAGAIVNPGTKIGDFATVGVNSSIGHDCEIGNYVNISPGVNIAGKVKMGDNSVAGIGSTIIEKVIVGKNSMIGIGSVVMNDISDGVVVFGMPAKTIQKRDLSKSYLR